MSVQIVQRRDREEPMRRREILAAMADRGDDEAVDILVAGLRDESPGVQQAAMNSLARVGGRGVVARLIDMLREPPAVRNAAAEVLERVVGDALESIPAIRGLSDPAVRKFMADILGKQADRRTVSHVMPLLEDPDANVRAAAAEALGHLGAEETVSRLIGLLNDEEWVVVSAISALAEIGDPAALPPLMEAIEKGPDAVRCAAIEAMARLDQAGRCVPVLLQQVDSWNPEVRDALVKALVAITDRIGCDLWAAQNTTTWLALLSETLSHGDPDSRAAAITVLGRLRDLRGTRLILNACRGWAYPGEDAIDLAVSALVSIGDAVPLIEALRPDETDMTLGTILMRALGRMRCAEAVPALTAVLLGSPNWELRKLAIQALGLIGTEEAMQGVSQAVRDPTGYVRSEALRVLSAADCLGELRFLLERLTEERYQEVREEIVAALAKAPTLDIGLSAVQLLDHPRADVRSAAARVIGRMALREGLDPLLGAMNDPEWTVRQAVVEALGRYDDPRAGDALKIAMSDDHEQVRLAAVVSLSQGDRPDGRAALIGLGLCDSDVWVRYRSIERLGALRATEAAAPLAKIAQDVREPDLLRQAAGLALSRIGERSTVDDSPCQLVRGFGGTPRAEESTGPPQ